MARLAGTRSATWRDLAVAVLHVLVLDHLLGPALGVEPRCEYVHELNAVRDATALAVLVPPPSMGHVAEIAGGGETMPAWSTAFHPKSLSGLVFNPLRMT